MTSRFKIILSAFLLLGTLYFLFMGLIHGKAFLIPLTTAVILSMLMNPVAKKFIGWGMGRGWAIFLSDLIIVLFIAFMIFLLLAQANNVAKNWSKIESKVRPKVEQFQKFYDDKFKSSLNELQQSGSPRSRDSGDQKQEDDSKEQAGPQKDDSQSAEPQNDTPQQQAGQPNEETAGGQENQTQTDQSFGTENVKNVLTGVVKNIFDFFSNLLLILVYIFFFMYYQKKFENAILGLVPQNRREKAESIINESAKIAQKYLFGRFILISILAVLYMIAFSLVGLEHAIFISLLAALFSLLPYIGNLFAIGLALVMSFISGGEAAQIIGIVVSFSIIQFIESYILEPYVVGDKVDLNPVIIIVGVVLGGLVWGVMGMLLVIPLLGILKVVLDNIEPLRPFGYILDERGISSDSGMTKKFQDWFQRKIKK